MNKKLVKDYIDWLSHDIMALNEDNVDYITTPFLDPVNDCNEVRITYTEDHRIRISDDATTLSMIAHNFRIKLNRSPSINAQFQVLADMYLMKTEGEELVRYCEEKEFPWAIHYFSIGVAAIQQSLLGRNFNKLYLRVAEAKNQEKESKLSHHIEQKFVAREINYNREVRKIGRSGFSHKFDFSFGENEKEPLILMKTPNALRPDNTQLMLFEWEDYLANVTTEKPTLFIVANDKTQIIDRKIIRLIRSRENTLFCPITDEKIWMERLSKGA